MTQHQNQNRFCKFKATEKFGEVSAEKIAHNYIQCAPLLRANLGKTQTAVTTDFCQNVGTKPLQHDSLLYDSDDSSKSKQNSDTSNDKMDMDEDDGFLPGNDDDDDMNPDINDESSVKSQELNEPDTSMLKSYEDYVQYSLINNMPLNKDELRAIRLVSTLRATAASLETYDRIMEWHFRETGELKDPHKLSDISGYVSRDVLFKKLRNRYKMTKYSEQITTKLKLPYAKSIATIVHYNAKDVILSLLTDPRIRDEDYLFFGNSTDDGSRTTPCKKY